MTTPAHVTLACETSHICPLCEKGVGEGQWKKANEKLTQQFIQVRDLTTTRKDKQIQDLIQKHTNQVQELEQKIAELTEQNTKLQSQADESKPVNATE